VAESARRQKQGNRRGRGRGRRWVRRQRRQRRRWRGKNSRRSKLYVMSRREWIIFISGKQIILPQVHIPFHTRLPLSRPRCRASERLPRSDVGWNTPCSLSIQVHHVPPLHGTPHHHPPTPLIRRIHLRTNRGNTTHQSQSSVLSPPIILQFRATCPVRVRCALSKLGGK